MPPPPSPTKLCALLLLWLPCACVLGDELDNRMNQALTDLRIRGASVAFSHPNLISPVIRAYGKTAASEDSPDVTTDTAFMLASVSKVFAGATVGVLVDQGVIQLDDDICQVLPPEFNETACRHPFFPDIPVTWRMVATHRASFLGGIPNVMDQEGNEVSASYGPTGGYVSDAPAAGNPTCPLTDTKGFYRDIMIDKESETMVGRDGLLVEGGQPLNWFDIAAMEGGVWNETEPPGTISVYSNFGIGYIAALVEYATNQTFEEYSQANLFAKLGMSNTTWFRANLPQGTLQAVPVHALEAGGFANVDHYCYIDYASGQLYSTANDMKLWGDAMLNLGVPELWSQSTATSAVFGCQEKDDKGNLLDNATCAYALTWELLNNAIRDSMEFDASNFLTPFANLDWTNGVMHAGAEEGAQTQVVVLPSAGVYSVVLTNTNENGDDAAQDLTYQLVTAALETLTATKGDDLQIEEATPASSTAPGTTPTNPPQGDTSPVSGASIHFSFQSTLMLSFASLIAGWQL